MWVFGCEKSPWGTMSTQNEAAWWDSRILTLFLTFATWRKLWVSMNVPLVWAQSSAAPWPFSSPVFTGAVPSPATTARLLREPWLPSLCKRVGNPKVWCGLQRTRMECPAEVTACALLQQGSTQLPAISGRWLCFGIPRSVTVSAYSVRMWRGKGSITVKLMCSVVMSQGFFWGGERLVFIRIPLVYHIGTLGSAFFFFFVSTISGDFLF